MSKIRKDIPLVDAIGTGVVLFSKATSIYYKKKKGVLMKFPAYKNSKKWETSEYTGTWKDGMQIAKEGDVEKIIEASKQGFSK